MRRAPSAWLSSGERSRRRALCNDVALRDHGPAGTVVAHGASMGSTVSNAVGNRRGMAVEANAAVAGPNPHSVAQVVRTTRAIRAFRMEFVTMVEDCFDLAMKAPALRRSAD